MGTDKALLPLGSATLLELALGKAREITPCRFIVGARERYAAYGDVIEDRTPGCGPLGGIHAALCTTQTDVNLVMSVDMPLMTAGFLRWLAQGASAGRELAVVPEVEGRLQPLCAVYKRAAKSVVEQALKAGDLKLSHIFSLLPTRYVSETEIQAAGFSPEIFRNINTPDDYRTFADAQLRSE